MQKDHALSINGVPGWYWVVKNRDVRSPLCFDGQKWVSTERAVKGYGPSHVMRVEIRHDDACKNKHNTFSITATIFKPGARDIAAGGCLHDEIRQYFPELAPLIRWHLANTDGLLHYVANTLYWLGWQGWCDDKAGSPPNLAHAQKTAVWPDMPADMICPQEWRVFGTGVKKSDKKDRADEIAATLEARLPALLADFRADVEKAGFMFTYDNPEQVTA